MGNLCTVDVFDVYDRQRPVELKLKTLTHTQSKARVTETYFACTVCMVRHWCSTSVHSTTLFSPELYHT